MKTIEKKSPSFGKAVNRLSTTSGRNPEEVFATYEANFKDQIALVEASKNGMDSQVLLDLAEISGLSLDQIAKQLLGIQNFKVGMNLPARSAEVVLKLLALYQKGIELFDDKDNFNQWLNEPAFGLGSQIPFNLLSMSTGIDLVMDELYRIEFGDLA